MGTKMLRADAEEVLRSLQMVGEGWYIQVGQWIKAGAHTALGMDEREFAASIGQRLRDPSDAIVEMFDQGHSQSRIARVLGVDPKTTVHNALVKAGRIEGEVRPPNVSGGSEQHQRSLPAGVARDSDAITAGVAADSDAVATANEEARKAQAEKEALEEALAAAKDQAKQQADALRDKIEAEQQERAKVEGWLKEYAEPKTAFHEMVNREVQHRRDEAAGILTEQDRQRHRKEREAWVAEQAAKFIDPLTKIKAGYVVETIDEATDSLRELAEEGMFADDLDAIAAATARLSEQVSAARLSVRATSKEDTA